MPSPFNYRLTIERDKLGRSYLKAYKNVWDRLKKQSRRSEKFHVGTLGDNNSIVFAETFLERFPSFKKGFFYYFDHQIVDEETFQSLQSEGTTETENFVDEFTTSDGVQSGTVRSYGATYCLNELGIKSGMRRSLKEVFGPLGKDLFNLAVFTALSDFANQDYEVWLADNLLLGARHQDGRRVSELLSAVTSEKFDEYFVARNRERNEKDTLGGSPLWALDSTSISTYSKTIKLAAHGYNKQGEDLAQINLVDVIDQDTGELVYGHIYNGSIPDIATLRTLLAKLQDADADPTKAILVLDRGYSSIENIDALLREGVSFIIGAKLSENAVKAQVLEKRRSLLNTTFRDPDMGIYATTYVDNNWGSGSAVRGGKEYQRVYLHLYRDATRATEEIESTDTAIKRTLKLLNDKENRDNKGKIKHWPDNYSTIKDYFIHDPQTNRFAINDPLWQEAQKLAGTFAIYTNTIEDPFLTLQAYRARGLIEQGFNIYKNEVSGRRLRVTESTFRGKILVCLLAQSLLMMLHRQLVDKRGQNKKAPFKVPGNSIPRLLRELSLIKAHKMRKNVRWMVDSITKKQRTAFAALGIEPPKRFILIRD